MIGCGIKHITLLHCLMVTELSSVFKSSWPDVPREWYNPSTVLPMDICASIKDALNPAVSPVSSINFDVVICVGDTLFAELKVSYNVLSEFTLHSTGLQIKYSWIKAVTFM
jgi:hypothetical protein